MTQSIRKGRGNFSMKLVSDDKSAGIPSADIIASLVSMPLTDNEQPTSNPSARRNRRSSKRSNTKSDCKQIIGDQSVVVKKGDSAISKENPAQAVSQAKVKGGGILNVSIRSGGKESPAISLDPQTRLEKVHAVFRLKPKSDIALSRDSSSVKQINRESSTVVELTPEEIIFASIKSTESKLQSECEKIKSSSSLADICLLGIANGAPELNKLVKDIEALYTDALHLNLAKFLDNRCCHKIVILGQRHLEFFAQISISKYHNTHLEKSQLRQLLQSKLAEIQRWAEIVASFIVSLQSALGGLQATAFSLPLFTELLSAIGSLYLGLGNLVKSKDSCMEKLNDPGRLKPVESLFYLWQYLAQAKVFSSGSGALYKALSSLVRQSKGCAYDIIHLLVMSLAVEVPLGSIREKLLGYFEIEKENSKKLSSQVVNALSMASFEDHMKGYQVHFIAACGMAYTRTDVDHMNSQFEKCRRHLGIMLQSISTEITIYMQEVANSTYSESSTKGSSRDFFRYNKSSTASISSNAFLDDCATINRSERLLRLIGSFDDLVFKSVVMTMSLIHSTAVKNDLQQIVASPYSSQQAQVESSKDIRSTNQSEVEDIFLKRHVQQQLHKIQCIPGLVDLIRVLLDVMITLFGVDGITAGAVDVGGSSGRLASLPLLKTLPLLRSVYLFLQWLDCNEEYHILSMIAKTSFESMEVSLLQFLSTFRTLTLAAKANVAAYGEIDFESMTQLTEDFDLRGWKPLSKSSYQSHSETNDVAKLLNTSMTISNLDPSSMGLDLDSSLHELFSASVFHSAYQAIPLSACNDSFAHRSLNEILRRIHRCKKLVKSLCGKIIYLGSNPIAASASTGEALVFNKNRNGVLASPQNLETCLCVLMAQRNATTTRDGSHSRPVGVSLLKGFGKTSHSLNSGSEANQLLTLTELENLLNDTIEDPTAHVEDSSDNGSDQDSRSDGSASLQAEADADAEDNAISELSITQISTENQKDSTAEPRKGLLHIPRSSLSTLTPAAKKKIVKQALETRRQIQIQYGPSSSISVNASSSSMGSNNRPAAFLTRSVAAADLPLIVVDAPNVAMKHGNNKRFSCRGIKLVIDFFRAAGHRVIAFLPDYYLKVERIGELRRVAMLNIGDIKASKIPDDVQLLQQLVEQGIIVGTPAQDYDDSYCINYARQRNGFIVSNDMYRDQFDRIENKQLKKELRDWLKTHLISYAFAGDEFLPNPDAKLNS